MQQTALHSHQKYGWSHLEGCRSACSCGLETTSESHQWWLVLGNATAGRGCSARRASKHLCPKQSPGATSWTLLAAWAFKVSLKGLCSCKVLDWGAPLTRVSSPYGDVSWSTNVILFSQIGNIILKAQRYYSQSSEITNARLNVLQMCAMGNQGLGKPPKREAVLLTAVCYTSSRGKPALSSCVLRCAVKGKQAPRGGLQRIVSKRLTCFSLVVLSFSSFAINFTSEGTDE